MSANQARTNRPYRKASEYLVASNKSPTPSGVPPQLSQENEILYQKLMATSRKLEHAEAEFAQSREYFEAQLDISHAREFKLNEQNRRLQSSYASLQVTNRELEHKLSKVNQLHSEKDMLVREVNDLSNKLTESRNALIKMQEENERLRKDCNIAVQLLKCNQSTYQIKRPDQLSDDVQDRLRSYKVELQDYNEYINPYASDSGSDEEVNHSNRTKSISTHNNNLSNRKMEDNEIPVEFIAEALRKPENVHLNLEPSDYIQDPALHSVYKAHYVERKLIKPDYGKRETGLASTHPRESRRKAGDSQVQQQRKASVSEEGSPWELAPSRRGVSRYESTPDDESPAGAYGAYSVVPKRKSRHNPDETHSPTKERACYNQSTYERNESYSVAPRSSSPEALTFRAPYRPPKTGIAGYFSKPNKGSSPLSSSSSSKKSTPLKVRGKEAATSAETSSLLNQSDSDDDVMVEISHYSSNPTSPSKNYMKEKNIGDEGGALLSSVDEPTDMPPPPTEIELEWDPEIPCDDTLTESPDANALAKQTESLSLDRQKPQSNLLLSYSNVESSQKVFSNDLEDLVSSPEHENFLTHNNQLYLPPPNPGGQLLSEIVTNNPSLSSFLMSTAPPPPEQFATIGNSSNPNLVSSVISKNKVGESSPFGEISDSSPPTRVDEQIEVIDLDEEPRKRSNRRRNSFDQAQEFGNVLNL